MIERQIFQETIRTFRVVVNGIERCDLLQRAIGRDQVGVDIGLPSPNRYLPFTAMLAPPVPLKGEPGMAVSLPVELAA